jgi:hypothetical protein
MSYRRTTDARLRSGLHERGDVPHRLVCDLHQLRAVGKLEAKLQVMRRSRVSESVSGSTAAHPDVSHRSSSCVAPCPGNWTPVGVDGE